MKRKVRRGGLRELPEGTEAEIVISSVEYIEAPPEKEAEIMAIFLQVLKRMEPEVRYFSRKPFPRHVRKWLDEHGFRGVR